VKASADNIARVAGPQMGTTVRRVVLRGEG
jgi:hypothetical protein